MFLKPFLITFCSMAGCFIQLKEYGIARCTWFAVMFGLLVHVKFCQNTGSPSRTLPRASWLPVHIVLQIPSPCKRHTHTHTLQTMAIHTHGHPDLHHFWVLISYKAYCVGDGLTQSSSHHSLAHVKDPYACPFFMLPKHQLQGLTVLLMPNISQALTRNVIISVIHFICQWFLFCD